MIGLVWSVWFGRKLVAVFAFFTFLKAGGSYVIRKDVFSVDALDVILIIWLCPMPKVIWSSYIFEKTHAHSQWSESPLLLRM